MSVDQAYALLTPDRLWTHEHTEDAIRSREASLREQGIQPGQVVMFHAVAQATTVWTLHALTRLGAVAMPVPAKLSPERSVSLKRARALPLREGTALRLSTSGTTGDPKVVDLTLGQLKASAQASCARLGNNEHDRWLCCLPLHHIGGLSVLLRTAFNRATAELHPRFDPKAVSASIDEGATMVSLVPTMLSQLLDARNDAPFPEHLRAILLGGAPTPPSLIDRCREIEAPVAVTWGMTETASQVATRVPGDLRSAPDVGKPLPGMGVTVEDGLLVVHGPVASDGCYRTADRGRIDEEGRIVVLGRGDDLIISGGENVAPLYVERILDSHPAVTEVAVVGRSDRQWGQQLVAFFVGEPDLNLLLWARDHLQPHERPAEAHRVDVLPRNAMGKVDRLALANDAEIRHGFPETRRD